MLLERSYSEYANDLETRKHMSVTSHFHSAEHNAKDTKPVCNCSRIDCSYKSRHKNVKESIYVIVAIVKVDNSGVRTCHGNSISEECRNRAQWWTNGNPGWTTVMSCIQRNYPGRNLKNM